MNKAQIKKAIFLTGTGGSYQVRHDIPGQSIVCHVPSVRIGNAIVAALRIEAESHELRSRAARAAVRHGRAKTKRAES